MAGNDGSLKFDTKLDTTGFEKGIKSIGSAAQKGMSATVKVMEGAAAGVTALAGAAIKAGSDFEAGMSQVQAVTGTVADKDLPGIIQKANEMGLSFEEGANTTETAMNILSAKAKQMGASTKFSATESAEALNYMAMAGWKTEDMLDGIGGIMDLAAASGEDLASTSDIVTDALTAFGLEAGDATHFADILASASSNANTNVGMMGETFKYVAPLAGAMGYSAEDTAVAIGLMANASIKAGPAGTALRAILTRMAKPTKESAMAMDALGLSITDSSGKMKPLSEVITDMRAGFAGLTEDEQASYAAMLGGQEAVSGLLAIVNASDKDFEKLSGAIADCNGSANEMAEIMQDNLQGQLIILQSGLEGLGVSMYETMQDTAKDVVKEAQEMVQQLQDAFAGGGFDGLVSAAGNVLAQIVQKIAGAAPMVVNAAVSLVHSFCEGLRNAQGIGESGAGLVTSLVTGLMSCAGEIWTTAIVLIGRLAEGIAAGTPQMVQAASTAILDFIQCLSGQLPAILSAGGSIITALVTGVTGMLPELGVQAVSIVSTIFDALMAALPQITGAGAGLLNCLAEGIAANLPALIPAAMSALVGFSGSLRENAGLLVDAGLNLIMALAGALIDSLPVFIETVPTIVTNIAGIINDNAPKLLAAGLELVGKLAAGLIQAVPTLVSNIPQIIEAVVSVFTAFNWLALGKNIITFITNGIKSLRASIPNALKGIGQTAKDWLRAINWRTLGSDIIDLIVIGVKSLLTAIPETLKSIGHMAVEFFKGIDWIDLGVNLINGLIAGITGALDGLWSAVSGLCSGMLDSIKGFFGIHSPSTVMAEQGDYLVQGLVNGIANMPAELAAYLDETVQKVIAWGQQMFSNAQSSIQNMVNAAVNLVSTLPGRFWTWFVNVVTKTVQWGQQMYNTARTAMSNMISAIVNLVSTLPGRFWAWFTDVIAKAVEWGRQMLNTATNAMDRMVSAIVNLVSTLPGRFWTWFTDVVSKAAEWGRQMLNTATNAMNSMISSIVSLVSTLPGKFWAWFTDIISKAADWGRQMIENARSAASSFISTISEWLSQLPGKVWGWLADTLSRVGEFASSLVSRAADAASGFVENITSGISGLPGRMAGIGSDIVHGIWNGISGGWGWLKDKVADVAGSLLSAAKGALGINSPSKAFRDEFGRWLMPGTVEGVKKSMPKTLRDMKEQAGELLSAMKGTVAASMGEISLNASAAGAGRLLTTAGTVVYNDNRMNQENNYHEKVISPAETAKNQREAFRKFAGGVK